MLLEPAMEFGMPSTSKTWYCCTELLLNKVLSGEDIPSGRKGIYFSETGDYTWMSLAQGLANEMYKQGALQTADVKQIALEEGAKLCANHLHQYAELGYGSK